MGTSPYTSICGGGRYDDLHRWIYRRLLKTQELRGQPITPPGTGVEQALNGVGLAFSVERLAAALTDAAPAPAPQVFVAVVDGAVNAEAFRFAGRLRRRGMAAQCHLPKAETAVTVAEQIDLATALGVRFIVLFSAEEWRHGRVGLHDLASGRQESATPENALATITEPLTEK